MKTSLLIATLALTTLGFEAFAKDVKPLPQIQPPRELVETDSEFAEGTITRLTARDVEVFLPWAQNAQSVLTKALADIENMPVDQQVRHLSGVMKSVTRRSGDKNYQLFMRFALNRGQLLVSELLQEADINDRGILENALDIQVKAIQVALAVHESDLAYQRRVAAGEATTELEYGNFGLKFGRSMLRAIDSVFDASAQYRLLYKTLEMVNWDLSRDAKAPDNADIIIDIYNTLTVMNEHPTNNDKDSILDIRRLHVLRESLKDASESVTGRISSSPVVTTSSGNSSYSDPRGGDIQSGVLVWYSGREFRVMGKDSENKYALKMDDYPYTTVSGVLRQSIGVKSGCSMLACAGKQVYVGTSQYRVMAITPSGKVTVKMDDYPYTVRTDLDPSLVAKTSGCLSDYNYRSICVGAGVISGTTQTKVVAIQTDGKVVTKMGDYPYTAVANVEPRNLVVIGGVQ